MKLAVLLTLTGCISLASLATAAPMDPELERFYGNEVEPSRADILNYLANLELQEELAEHYGPMKPKRRSRWGNKYADNKSYGFWITALNKAGNYKRGKRGEPFIPAMSAPQPPLNLARIFSEGDKKDMKELIADHDYTGGESN